MNVTKKLLAICKTCRNDICKCRDCIGKEKHCNGDCSLIQTVEFIEKCKKNHETWRISAKDKGRV